MATVSGWTRQQLLVAFNLYCQMPFGKIHSRNPEIIKHAKLIGRTPSALAMKMSNIASFDPAITSTGRSGLRSASIADKAMWDEMQADWENFVLESYQAVRDLEPEPKDNVELDENLIAVEQQDYAGSDKVVETKVRVGQSFFRKSVLSAYNYRCCITGLALPTLLVASHIVPWRKDVENRLNPKNGLALSTIHDRAFDQGIITISQDMTVLVSKEAYVQGDDFFSDTLMKYNGKPIFLPNKFQPHADFLAYHREIVFERWQRQE